MQVTAFFCYGALGSGLMGGGNNGANVASFELMFLMELEPSTMLHASLITMLLGAIMSSSTRICRPTGLPSLIKLESSIMVHPSVDYDVFWHHSGHECTHSVIFWFSCKRPFDPCFSTRNYRIPSGVWGRRMDAGPLSLRNRCYPHSRINESVGEVARCSEGRR